jgi:hypothetical protein
MTDIAGNTLETALNLDFLSNVTQIIKDEIGGGDFADYYRFKLAENSTVSLALTELSQDANIYVVNSEGNRELTRSVNAGTVDECISVLHSCR